MAVLDVDIERAVEASVESQSLLSEPGIQPMRPKLMPQLTPPAGGSLEVVGHLLKVGTVRHGVCRIIPTPLAYGPLADREKRAQGRRRGGRNGT